MGLGLAMVEERVVDLALGDMDGNSSGYNFFFLLATSVDLCRITRSYLILVVYNLMKNSNNQVNRRTADARCLNG